MQRLSRAGREAAIVSAIQRLNSIGKNKMHTKGEICRKMGIVSTSKIRDILYDMVACGKLVSAATFIDGYQDEVAIYGVPIYEQVPLPQDHEIIINGVSCRMSEVEVQYA